MIDKYTHDDWVTYFSGGKWSLLGASSWISLYTRRPLNDRLDNFVTQTMVLFDGETTTGYIRESERANFGKRVVDLVLNNPSYVDEICEGFISGADYALNLYDKTEPLTYEQYAEYNKKFLDSYYHFHLQVKNVVDFLPEDLLKKYLPKLEEARLHAEPVFSREIGFMKNLAVNLSNQTNYTPEQILFTLTTELTDYWRDGKNLPGQEVLNERQNGCVALFKNGGVEKLLVGEDVKNFSSFFVVQSDSEVIKGQSAYKGQVKGVVRVIYDPSNVREFNEGDILVAPWTRPEYLPIMKKAGAFITDGGGILSHAAIVARELHKPCVIATNIATQMLKDGDVVDVNADTGEIKKVNS